MNMANIMYCICIFVNIGLLNTATDYGYFDYKVTHLESCQGPKRRNCCNTSMKLINNVILYDMDCKEKVSPTRAKVVASKSNQSIRFQMDKPCAHVFIRPLITKLFNTSDCVIPKANNKFSIDVVELAQKYYSGMFLYGNWTFKSTVFSENCNILCMVQNVSVQPKP